MSSSSSRRRSVFITGLIKSLRSTSCTTDNTIICNVNMVNTVRPDVEGCDKIECISLLQCRTTELTSMTRETNEEENFDRLQINSVQTLM